jgi:hypothetical protein
VNGALAKTKLTAGFIAGLTGRLPLIQPWPERQHETL